jgi:ABC-type transport system involved in multi-copper enzyme maturation permease subunit
MTAVGASTRASAAGGSGGLGPATSAEWVKFRTVRGWPLGLVLAAALSVAFAFLVANGQHQDTCVGRGVCHPGHSFVPTGPGGEAVADSYRYLARPLTGDGAVTVRITSLRGRLAVGPANRAPSAARSRPGLVPWAKAGILLTSSIRQGSPYAAVMATGGHGARLQYDYVHDRTGMPGAATSSSPRWLRLIRAGDTVTAYDSRDGAGWHEIGAAHLAGLPATVEIGLFVTSPLTDAGNATDATASFDRIAVGGRPPAGGWHADSIGVGPHDYYPTLGAGGGGPSGAGAVLTGSGDIAPAVATIAGGDTAAATLRFGLIVALIVLTVIAAMFATSEYRRGLIRTTLAATPRRASVLAAKALVLAAAAFATGVVATAVALAIAEHALRGNGDYIFPTSAATLARVIAGTGALLAFSAVAVLALGVILRRSAGAVTVGILVFVLPYLLGPGVLGPGASGGAVTWLFRATPAAAFSVLGALPRSSLVEYPFTLANGYYPLPPLAGLAVLAAYAAAALALAALVLRRRDA